MNQNFDNNENLNSEFRTIKYQYQDIEFSFLSDLGVFSKDYIDYGSQLLVESILKTNKSYPKILDVGCGYGYIGIVLAKVLNSQVDLIDINNRCVHLTNKNIKANSINGNSFISNSYENIKDKYDLIVTNPPIREGKKIILDILLNAKNYLNPSGELWMVLRKDQGAKSIVKALNDVFVNTEIKKSKGFSVFCAKIIDN